MLSVSGLTVTLASPLTDSAASGTALRVLPDDIRGLALDGGDGFVRATALRTELTAGAADTATALVVASTIGIDEGTIVALTLDDGSEFTTTVASVVGNTVNLANPLTDSVALGTVLIVEPISLDVLGQKLTGSFGFEQLVEPGETTVRFFDLIGTELTFGDDGAGGALLSAKVVGATDPPPVLVNDADGADFTVFAPTGGANFADLTVRVSENGVDFSAPLTLLAPVRIEGDEFRIQTSLASAALDTATTVEVVSTDAIVVGATVTLTLNSGIDFTTTVATVAGPTITLGAALTGAAAAGNVLTIDLARSYDLAEVGVEFARFIKLQGPLGSSFEIDALGIVAGREGQADLLFPEFGVPDGVSFDVGNGALLVIGTSEAPPVLPEIRVSAAGLVVDLQVAVTANIASASLSGNFALQMVTTDPLASFVRVVGIGAVLEVQGQRISGNFSAEQSVDGNGSSVVNIAVAGLAMSLSEGDTEFLNVSGGSGALVLLADGIAGRASATAMLNIPGVALANATVDIQLNTAPVAVADTFSIGTRSITLDVPAGPFVRIAALDARLSLSDDPSAGGSLAAELAGDFLFQQQSVSLLVQQAVSSATVTDADSNFLAVADSDLSRLTLELTDGTGVGQSALITANTSTALVLDSGLAVDATSVYSIVVLNGIVDAVLGSTVTDLGAGSLANLAGLTFEVVAGTGAGETRQITASAGSILVLDSALTVDDTSEYRILLTGTLDAAAVATSTFVALSDLSVTFEGQGLQNGEGAFLITAAGVAGFVSGSASVDGGGVSVGATLGLRINTTGTVIDPAV